MLEITSTAQKFCGALDEGLAESINKDTLLTFTTDFSAFI
jgi:hypothetical protein